MGKPRILVAVDFSEESALAVAEAKALSRSLGLSLEAIHVTSAGNGHANDVDDAGVAWLEAAGLAPSDLVSRSGLPWVEIVRFAKQRQASMIIAGSHGASGYQPLAPGTTAGRLAVVAPCPVLLVNARSSGLAAHGYGVGIGAGSAVRRIGSSDTSDSPAVQKRASRRAFRKSNRKET